MPDDIAGSSGQHSPPEQHALPGLHSSRDGGSGSCAESPGAPEGPCSTREASIDPAGPGAAGAVTPAALPPPEAHLDSGGSSEGLWGRAEVVHQAQEALQSFLERIGLHEHLRVVPTRNGALERSAACSSTPLCTTVQQTAHLSDELVMRLSLAHLS